MDVVPPAPWTLALEGLVWLHRAVPRVASGHPLPVTVGGFARYGSSPVGPYAEVWGAPRLMLRRGVPTLSVPFMAVDSEASLRAGRANWALPKELARFDREPWSAAGEGWSMRARVVSTGLRLPFAAVGCLLQVAPDGAAVRTRATAYGTARLARVAVEGRPPPWLVAGRHRGLQIERGTLTIGEPRLR